MKNIMKEAHEMTRRIIKKGDSYKATFRLCLIFVHSQIKKVVVSMSKSDLYKDSIMKYMPAIVEYCEAIKSEKRRNKNVICVNIAKEVVTNGSEEDVVKLEKVYNVIRDYEKVLTIKEDAKVPCANILSAIFSSVMDIKGESIFN